MASTNKNSSFWISYADLMTSLFFIMLVLFLVVLGRLFYTGKVTVDVAKLRREIAELREENKQLSVRIKDLQEELNQVNGDKDATEEQLNKLRELFNVQKKIDSKYFIYDEKFQRFTLRNFTALFKTNSPDIMDIPYAQRQDLLNIGKSLKQTFEKAQSDVKTKSAQYLLIVEGQASKDNYANNYELSYSRALSLVKFWNKNGIKFPSNCEIIISGSGQSSKFRNTPDIPPKNQRFVIHILPKPGEIPNISK